LPASADLWSIYGAQNDPFPLTMHPQWQTLVWESIHQNGSGCDYVSEAVIQDAIIQNGSLVYGPRKYQSIFLTQVESIEPITAKKLFEFIAAGGRIFFIESFPTKAPGWKDHQRRDQEVKEWMTKIKSYTERCILLNKPGPDHTSWFKAVQEKYNVQPYVQITSPGKFVSQVRYQANDAEILVLINANINASCQITVTPSPAVRPGKQAWIWDAETGERLPLHADNGSLFLDLAPADLKLIVFDKSKKGASYKEVRRENGVPLITSHPWSVTGRHINGAIIKTEMQQLQDLKEMEEWKTFCGTITYENSFFISDKRNLEWLDLGKAFGVSELFINGRNAGVKWYGRRTYPVGKFLKNGNNTIEIKIVTTMGNYMKSLADHPVAQAWTNQGRTNQPVQSVGLVGSVSIF
jgi:hypothetical protein